MSRTTNKEPHGKYHRILQPESGHLGNSLFGGLLLSLEEIECFVQGPLFFA